MNYIPLILLLIGGIILTVGDIIMKKWVINKSILIFIFGLFIYLIALIFLSISFQYKNIAVASAIFVIFNIITLSLFSWFYFKEKLSLVQIIAMALGLISILILEIYNK